MKSALVGFLLWLSCLLFIRCDQHSQHLSSKSVTTDSLKHILFKMGFKNEGNNTGPLLNTFFNFKLNDSTPPIMLTAHHAVAFKDGGYYNWDQLKHNNPTAWLWATDDTTRQMPLGKNLPIPGAKTLHADIAAYYLPKTNNDVHYLVPAKDNAIAGDTVYLYSKLKIESSYTLINPGLVVYATDSVMVYELLNVKLIQMGGTSGSPVLNLELDVVSNSFGGLAVASPKDIEQAIKIFPPLTNAKLRVGKTYGIGLPIGIIKQSLTSAFILKEKAIDQ